MTSFRVRLRNTPPSPKVNVSKTSLTVCVRPSKASQLRSAPVAKMRQPMIINSMQICYRGGKKLHLGSTLPMQILLRNFNPIVRLKINFRGVMGDLKEMGPISVPQGYRFDRLNPLQVLYMT